MHIPAPLRTLIFRGLRLAFRITPLSGPARDRLRKRFVDRHASLVPIPRGSAPAGGTASRRAWDHSAHRALTFRPRRAGFVPSPAPATVVAFYLPQFHPFPENDAWWGTGFTEWRNVGRALPQYEGHHQPRVPADLGYYDLRLPEIMREQMAFAREYGVGAFCTYFYWFAGKTLMEAPLRQWLADPGLDLPICLCWANENWSRRWDGLANEILISQQHSAADDTAFIEHVSEYLKDPRYLRVEGKPLLLVYRPGLLTDAAATADRWRTWCRENGVGEIHLAYVQSFDSMAPASIGFDSAVSFPPNNARLNPVTADFRLINADYRGQIYDWRELAHKAMSTPDPDYRLFPCVNPGWDNEARRSGQGLSLARATPRAFSSWVRHAIAAARRRSPKAPLVFVNAWNEWAEGAILEPDVRFGFAWLEAIRSALLPLPTVPHRPCAIVHVWYPELLDEIATALAATAVTFRIVLTVPAERESEVRAEMTRLAMEAEVEVVPNRGRDVLPFLRVASRLLDEGEDVVLKLHTKRSVHRNDGGVWRAELLDRLVSPTRARAVLQAFEADSALGVVGPEGHVQRLDDFVGSNAEATAYLNALTGISPAPGKDIFIAGSMFWCRLSALAPIIDAPLADDEFESEGGQIDGTMAHAVERFFVRTAVAEGYGHTTVARLVGEPEPHGPYPYASRG